MMRTQSRHDRHNRPFIALRRVLLALTLLLALGLAAIGASAQVTVDTDGDGLMDEEELQLGTDPANSDTDADRLSDGFEARELGTDPLRADSDEDGLGDGTEVDAGTDPRIASSYPRGDEPTPTESAAQPADGNGSGLCAGLLISGAVLGSLAGAC